MKYDHWIHVQEIIPPLGENRFAAYAEIHEIGKGRIVHNLGEVYGKTHEEADTKMQIKIKEWLERN